MSKKLEIIKSRSLIEKGKIKGKCLQCGNCCEYAWKFAYFIDHEKELLIRDVYDYKPVHRKLCKCWDQKTKKCSIHKDKPLICKYWPFFKEELELVACSGFKYIGD